MHPAHLDPSPSDVDDLRAVVMTLSGDSDLRFTGKSDDIRHDNNLRASWAARAVLHYADITMAGGSGENIDTAIGDLLGDLMHLSDALGLNFAALLDGGQRHYLPEVAGEL